MPSGDDDDSEGGGSGKNERLIVWDFLARSSADYYPSGLDNGKPTPIPPSRSKTQACVEPFQAAAPPHRRAKHIRPCNSRGNSLPSLEFP